MNSDYVVPWTRGDAVSPVDNVVVIDGDDDASSERREVLKHNAASDDESFDSDVALNQFDVDSYVCEREMNNNRHFGFDNGLFFLKKKQIGR